MIANTTPAIPALIRFLVAAVDVVIGDRIHVDPVEGWCPVVAINVDADGQTIRTVVQASRGERISFAWGAGRTDVPVMRPNPAKAIAELPRVSAEAAFDGDFDGDFVVLTFD